MIEGFEDITYDLTDQEKQLVPLFVNGFKTKIGKDNAITSAEIIKKMPQYNLSGARIRKIINYIRNSWLVPGLIATSSGYYITTDPGEVQSYINSLGHREAAIGTVRKGMEEYLNQLKKHQ